MSNVIKTTGRLLVCCGALNAALAAKVAVFKDPELLASQAQSSSDMIAAALKGQEGLEVELVGKLDAPSVKPFTVLIVPNVGGASAQAMNENQAFLRQWVADGHGLLTAHDAVGYRNHVALFPEIASGNGNFYTTQQAFKNEFCLVAEHPVLTAGMDLKQRHATSYYDLITLSPGPQGHIVARAVVTSGKGLFSGAPAAIAGQVGKGRYAACGLALGSLAPKATPVEPRDGERLLLLNLVRFLSGQGEPSGFSDDLGPNAFLGAAPIQENPWEKKLPGLSVEKLLAACQIPCENTVWKDSLSRKPYALNDVEPGTPAISEPLLQFYTTVEPYDPLPATWTRIPIENWTYTEITNTADNPANDAGTAGGYWKTDFAGQGWTNYPATGKRPWVAGVRWHRAHLVLPPAAPGKRAILCFDGVDHSAVVYVNGQPIGSHQGPGIPFEFDITAAAKPGADNVIAVRTYNGLYERVSVQIRPDVYAERLLIDPKTSNSTMEVKATLVNSTGAARDLELEAEVAPYSRMAPWIEGKRATTRASLGKVAVAPGKSEHRFTIVLKRPVCWTPENPFLYVLNLRDGKMDVAQERFGFRTFVQDGRFFLLNGKRVYLRGAVACDSIVMACPRWEYIRNTGRLMERTLLAYKALNFNILNPQAIGASLPREFFDNCDEIGMLLYDLNPYHDIPYDLSRENTMLMARYDDSKGVPENLKIHPDYLPNIERYFLRNYNHPSCVLFAISTEKRYAVYRKALQAGYDLVKRIDGQNRPVCPCSGDNPSQTSFEFSDVSDLHVYPGEINSHPWDHKKLIDDYNQITWEYLGKNIPVINFEAGGFFHVVADKEFKPIRELWTNATPDKAAIVRNIEGKDVGYHMPSNARWLTLYGIRRYAVDDYNRARKEKRPVSSYRQEYMVRNQIASSRLAGDLFQGYGINFARMYTAFATLPDRKDGYLFEFSDLRSYWPVESFRTNPVLAATGFNVIRRYSNPKLVLPDLLRAKHVFAGQSFETTLFAINDTGDDSGKQAVRIVLYDTIDNRRLLDRTAAIGVVPAAKRKLVPFKWDIPADMPTSTVRLELFLVEDGKVVSDSSCEFHVLGKSEFAARIPVNGKRVAVYDSAADNGSPTRSTAAVMDRLGIPYTRLTDFSKLADFDVLIVGAASADNQVYKSNAAIAAWLEKGGRMLAFEQQQPGAVAGIPKLNIVRKMGGSVADMIVPAHPVFAGLQANDYWSLWNGDLPEAQAYGREGGIYTCLIGPLNETVLATGVMDVPRGNPKAVQMAIADVKVGKGMALISQVEATLRYGKDSVATKYLQNALRYILSGESSFSTPLSGFTVNALDFYNFGFVDMKPLAGRARAFSPDWVEMMQGGLKDLGQIQFRLEPGKVLGLGGSNASVVVALPAGMPLMFPEREKEKVLKDVDQGTLNRGMFDTLYFLYAAGKAGPDPAVGECTLRYKNGATVTSPIVLGKTIGLDGRQDAIEDGKYVGAGMYVARVVNPSQDKEVAAIELKAAPGCELVIAGVTATLARERVHD